MNLKFEISIDSNDSQVVASVLADMGAYMKLAMNGVSGIGANLPAFKAIGKDSIFSCDLRGDGKITIKLFK